MYTTHRYNIIILDVKNGKSKNTVNYIYRNLSSERHTCKYGNLYTFGVYVFAEEDRKHVRILANVLYIILYGMGRMADNIWNVHAISHYRRFIYILYILYNKRFLDFI